MNWLDRSHRGDCRDLMRAMVADGVRVQTIVTSPPYWGLRSYLPDGHPDKHREIGQEPTLREFIDTLVGVFDLARELLADDGTLWLNMGDAYAGSWGAQGRGGQMACRSTISAQQIAAAQRKQSGTGSLSRSGLKAKDLMGQPWRLAFALQDAGWYLRQDIIWHKPNPMPESVRDRCTKAHESVPAEQEPEVLLRPGSDPRTRQPEHACAPVAERAGADRQRALERRDEDEREHEGRRPRCRMGARN